MNVPRQFLNRPYAESAGRTLLLDLYLPANAGTPLPAVVWIRGGGWRFSEKPDPYYGLTLAADGFAAAVIEYRSSDEIIAPGNVHDCKAAVRWLRAHAAEYGIDPRRIAAAGSSAGGHLAALLGVAGNVPALEGARGHHHVSSAVQAAVDFSGPSDLTYIARPETRSKFPVLYEVTAVYVGGPVEAQTARARLVSPLEYVSRSVAPLLIVHGDADDVVPVEESCRLQAALQAAGAQSTLRVLPGVGHTWDWELTRSEVIGFLRRHLSAPNNPSV